MNTLFDDIARIIASPVSRRQAVRLVSGAIGGAVLTSLGLARPFQAGAAAAVTCPTGSSPCTNGTKSACCVNDAQKCCNDVGAYCCTSSQTCCRGKCCTSGAICCRGKCCKAGPDHSHPCVGAVCPSGLAKDAAIAGGVGGGTAATVAALASSKGCPSGQSKCGSTCCPNSQTCCGGKNCCTPGTICCPGGGQALCCGAGPSPSTPCVGATKCS